MKTQVTNLKRKLFLFGSPKMNIPFIHFFCYYPKGI